MNQTNIKETQDKDALAMLIMTMLNLLTLSITATILWSLYRLYQNSGAIGEGLAGNFLP